MQQRFLHKCIMGLTIYYEALLQSSTAMNLCSLNITAH